MTGRPIRTVSLNMTPPITKIITDPHEILLFSVCIKSTIVVFKMTKQLSEENGGGPFCQQGNYKG